MLEKAKKLGAKKKRRDEMKNLSLPEDEIDALYKDYEDVDESFDEE